MTSEKEHLLEYNRLYKENDELYRNAARELGLNDCAFWILYFLWENAEGADGLTQSDICSMIYTPKQTVNSSLKRLEEDGYLRLTEGSDRRSKLVGLTSRGKELAAETVDRVMEAELRAMGKLTEEEQTAFLGLFRKYTDLLKGEIRKIGAAEEKEPGGKRSGEKDFRKA